MSIATPWIGHRPFGLPIGRRLHPSHPVIGASIIGLGVALAVLVGTAGSPVWQLARVALAVAATGAAELAVTRFACRGVGTVAVGVGLAGIVGGAGIAGQEVRTGWSLRAVFAGVALAAGLGLVGMGATLLLRAARRWQRLWSVPVAFVAFQFVLLPGTLAVFATNVVPASLGRSTPADRGLAYADVSFRTADGVRLSGWYVASRNGAAVAVLPGSSSTRSSVLDHGAVLARHGYGVLFLDTRGHGRSGGNAMDFGWYGDRDVRAAVSFLLAQPDVRIPRVGLVGLSMGGEEAIGAAASDSRIGAVVAEGVAGRSAADTGWMANDLVGWIDRGSVWVRDRVCELLSDAPRPIGMRRAIAAAAPRPLLLIAGKQELAAGRFLAAAAPATAELWELPDTAHTRALATHPQAWETRVVAFLHSALVSSP